MYPKATDENHIPDSFTHFRTRPGVEQVRIALTSGHVTVVTEQWKPLAPIFHKEALAKGCVTKEMVAAFQDVDLSGGGDDEPSRDELIKAEIKAMLEDADPKLFTDDEKPRADVLSDRLGFRVTAADRDAAFEALHQEALASGGGE